MRLGLPLIAFVMGPVVGRGQMQVQGHRGCRGHLPENTIPGFLHTLDLGVDVLELDVVISRDGQVIVSHEPWMNPDICLGPHGQSLRGKSKVNIYELTLAEIQSYDCGALGHKRFPSQQPCFVHKPTLEEVFQAVSQWQLDHPDRACSFNIEIKRMPAYDGRFCPPFQEYCARVLTVLDASGFGHQCNLQSFDPETLEYLHRTRPEIPLAFLVERGSFTRNRKKLTFLPQIYSPKFRLLDPEEVALIKKTGLSVIPWTVNEEKDIRYMFELGVDGIISDYPDRVLQFHP
ncbi:MAG: glycerophosphodiester phosphodiesterase [Saprospiraceae bacterium]|nr:glycerophosphodiester phosphodiesterase [Saprospiraceae bacterium]